MLSTSHTGAAAELFVSNWLMMQGCLVFRNCSPHGPIDLIATNNDAVVKIDVKSQLKMTYRMDGAEQINCGFLGLREDNVWQILYVHGELSPRIPDGFLEALGMNHHE